MSSTSTAGASISIAERWCSARRRRRPRRSGGLDLRRGQRQKQREPHRLASETLVAEIRRELRDVAGIVLA